MIKSKVLGHRGIKPIRTRVQGLLDYVKLDKESPMYQTFSNLLHPFVKFNPLPTPYFT